MKTIFNESQKFRQWWLWLLLVLLTIISLYAFYKQIILGESFGSRPMPDSGLYVFILSTVFLLLFFWFLKLKTTITQDEIVMHYFPIKRKIKWSEIKNANVIDYGFVGGWGIRFPTKYGTVYNTQGSKGLAIELKNGKKFLIGTQKGKELKNIVEKCLIIEVK